MLLLKKEKPQLAYTLRMAMTEEALMPTIMVMYRVGEHQEVWNVCSHMCAGRGLTRAESLIVVRNAEERAKRRMGA